MAKYSVRQKLSTIVICEGDLLDPRFPAQLNTVTNSLNDILGDSVKVRKLEPWNSVRVTLSIPREAALRLRQLANEGSQQLRALGILSIQVDGEQVISLRLATGSVNSEPQEIILRTSQDGSTSGSSNRYEQDLGLSNFLQTNTTSTSLNTNNTQVQFKSPNVVCPSDSVVPKVGTSSVASNRPFPFTSMNQAIHSNRESPFNSLPPPYPGKPPPATISSPLLVNLLQNDGAPKEPGGGGGAKAAGRPTSATPGAAAAAVARPNLLLNNCISPSALSTNTSIRQNSTILTSTTAGAMHNKPPPPQYHRALSSSSMVIQYSMTGPQNSSASANPQPTPLSQTAMSHTPQPPPSTPAQQAPVPLQQINVYQSQNAALVTKKNPLANNSTMPNHLTMNNFHLLKHPAPNKVHGLTHPVRPSSGMMAKNVGPGAQAKAAAMNHSLKQALSQAMPKSSNTFNPQQLSKAKNNFILSHALSAGSGGSATEAAPPPPPYPLRGPWDTPAPPGGGGSPLLDLTPTLTDLRADELDALLPTLERELTHSPLPELPEDFLADHPGLLSSAAEEMAAIGGDRRKMLINPLTGELEPQSSGESDTEDLKDVFTGLPSPAALSDDDTCSTTRPDPTTDQSDSETRSSDPGNKPAARPKAAARARDSPALLRPDKIKLRLKLEKSEPVSAAYKVDVSFVNQQPKKALSASSLASGVEEPRVPPLHISLRGRNSVVIKNKSKARRGADHARPRKADDGAGVPAGVATTEGGAAMPAGDGKARAAATAAAEPRKVKKLKTGHELKDVPGLMIQENDPKPTKFALHNHYKDKQKERRGSDSDLAKNNKKHSDLNGDDKRRRLSEQPDAVVLGSTNVGTISHHLPQKPRKDKAAKQQKEPFKAKAFGKDKQQLQLGKPVALPLAGEMNMEAKFKQGLLEGAAEKGVPRPPHRTEVVNHVTAETGVAADADRGGMTTTKSAATVSAAAANAASHQKSPLPEERKRCAEPVAIVAAAPPGGRSPAPTAATAGGRSPAPSAANQGEDSGIESMDALSEKSPNQASQSPHAGDAPPAIKARHQPPDLLLDIEAQLAEMEGIDGDADRQELSGNVNRMEDVNENKCNKDQTGKKCCELTCVLQDSIKQAAVTLASVLESPTMPDVQKSEISLVPLKTKKDDDELEPLPVRVTPALYTYSNPEKGRAGSESPTLSDEDDDSDSCSTSTGTPPGGGVGGKQGKSLLEQLLIEIPGDHQAAPSSPSPATRSSVRTRALSKMNSPELSSPVAAASKVGVAGVGARTTPMAAKRKRNASDSSNHSTDETRKKMRKAGDGVATLPDPHGTQPVTKTRQTESMVKANNAKKPLVSKVQDESSDSDEPLIEKVRKPSAGGANAHQTNNASAKTAKLKGGGGGPGTVANVNNKVALVVNTRRSVRSNMPAQNTRSKGDNKLNALESEALRRKTRSTVTDVESKRKKEVK